MSRVHGRKAHGWHAIFLRVLALFGIGLSGMSARAEDYEDWLGIG